LGSYSIPLEASAGLRRPGTGLEVTPPAEAADDDVGVKAVAGLAEAIFSLIVAVSQVF
jgi:hypothetical protein